MMRGILMPFIKKQVVGIGKCLGKGILGLVLEILTLPSLYDISIDTSCRHLHVWTGLGLENSRNTFMNHLLGYFINLPLSRHRQTLGYDEKKKIQTLPS